MTTDHATCSPLPTVILLPEAAASGRVSRKLPRFQAVSAWKLAKEFGHLWGTEIPQNEAVKVLMQEGGSLTPLLPVDSEGYTPPGVDRVYLDTDGSTVHSSGSRSVTWRVDRRGAVKAEIRLRAEYPRPIHEGELFARVEIDPGAGRVEVEVDGLHFENHKGEWRFAAPRGRVVAPPIERRRDGAAAHAAGCLNMVLRAFGLLPPKHVTKITTQYDAACVAAYDAAFAE